MNQIIKHKKSNVVTEDGAAKLPTSEQLTYGELAINYADGHETITIKNSANEIVSFKSQEYIDDNDLFAKGTGKNSIVRKNGGKSDASKTNAIAVGYNVTASGVYSFAEGYGTTASGTYSHAEGRDTTASGDYGSHAEGMGSSGDNKSTTASGDYGSHAEGFVTTASGNFGSHAEGSVTVASGDKSHAEGYFTTASGVEAHAEGLYTTASGNASHAEGSHTTASGTYSHAEGSHTTASGTYSHAEGRYNLSSTLSIHSVGIGTSDTDKKNAEDISYDGAKYLIGLGGYDGTNLTVTDEDTETESINPDIKSVQEILQDDCTLLYYDGIGVLSSGALSTDTISDSFNVVYWEQQGGFWAYSSEIGYYNWNAYNDYAASSEYGEGDETKGVIPQTGKLYYNTTDEQIYVWDGSTLVAMGPVSLWTKVKALVSAEEVNRKATDYLPLSGGTMDSDATIIISTEDETAPPFVYQTYDKSTLTAKGLNITYHGALILDENSNASYYRHGITTDHGSLIFPTKGGTFALTSDIQNMSLVDTNTTTTINDTVVQGWFTSVFEDKTEDNVSCSSAHIIDLDRDKRIAIVRYTFQTDTNPCGVFINDTCIGGGLPSGTDGSLSVIVSVPYDKDGKIALFDENGKYILKRIN